MFRLTLIKTGGGRPKTKAQAAHPNSNLFGCSDFYHARQSPFLILRRTAEAGESRHAHGFGFAKATKGTLDSSSATIQYVRVAQRTTPVASDDSLRGCS
jgi:hypothetical protein